MSPRAKKAKASLWVPGRWRLVVGSVGRLIEPGRAVTDEMSRRLTARFQALGLRYKEPELAGELQVRFTRAVRKGRLIELKAGPVRPGPVGSFEVTFDIRFEGEVRGSPSPHDLLTVWDGEEQLVDELDTVKEFVQERVLVGGDRSEPAQKKSKRRTKEQPLEQWVVKVTRKQSVVVPVSAPSAKAAERLAAHTVRRPDAFEKSGLQWEDEPTGRWTVSIPRRKR